ncbi:hypothetical protein O2K51_07610 [Apibacter raozihei]|uniref:hypothetical protein n=1 Tax=Apibacter raozihei TaxID=2500547 RepID=UPI000FE31EA6|nr:hypothetical protein [Apibacter raozihei]
MVSQKFKSSSLRENIFPWNEFGKNLFSANENLSIEQKIQLIDHRIAAFRKNYFPLALFSKRFKHFRILEENWSKMNTQQKIKFIHDNEYSMNEEINEVSLITELDKKCNSWLSMSTDDKKLWLQQKKITTFNLVVENYFF